MSLMRTYRPRWKNCINSNDFYRKEGNGMWHKNGWLRVGVLVLLASVLLLGYAGCEGLDINHKTLLGAAIKSNAPNAKTQKGAYQATVAGDALIGEGQAEAGKSNQTVIVNNGGGGGGGVLPAGFPHPSWPHVVSDGKGGWEPAPGYRWLTQDDGDPRVVKN
jgi:hypothetical protein